MAKFVVTALMAALWLAGCAQIGAARPGQPGSSATRAQVQDMQRYRCDPGFAVTVRFADDSAVVDAGPRGNDVLLRDAGGSTPQQTVYSNARLRAEFGLGESGREAMLRYAQPPLAAHCVRD